MAVLRWGLLSDSLDEDTRIIEGERDYHILVDMRNAIVRMRHLPLHRFAMAEGVKIIIQTRMSNVDTACVPSGRGNLLDNVRD